MQCSGNGSHCMKLNHDICLQTDNEGIGAYMKPSEITENSFNNKWRVFPMCQYSENQCVRMYIFESKKVLALIFGVVIGNLGELGF